MWLDLGSLLLEHGKTEDARACLAYARDFSSPSSPMTRHLEGRILQVLSFNSIDLFPANNTSLDSCCMALGLCLLACFKHGIQARFAQNL